MKQKINIAIDGPAGAGKSTVAKKVAEKLSYTYIDTGAMYRAITYKALKNNIDLNDERSLKNLIDTISISLSYEENGMYVLVNNEDVTNYIRDHEVTKNVSLVASHQVIREAMLKQQQSLAKFGGAVMDGRDIGTYVLPNAEVKIFLTASVSERAKRRYEENIEKGIPTDLHKLEQEIALRDNLDSTREIAPLKKAVDAIEVDTTSLTIDDVVEIIFELVKERLS